MSDAVAGVDDGSAARRASAPGSDPLARIVFALLVLACFAAFLITQRLKHTPTAVQDFKLTPFFSPYPLGHVKQAAISFKLSHAEAVTVTILDTRGNTVATLVRHHPVARYKQFSLRWNGHRGVAHRVVTRTTPRGLAFVSPQNDGAVAPAGEYRVRVALAHHGPVLSPQSFTLVAP
ncbi:MAG TPA: hypothetical protein VK680_12460 [Solirubrobacteraceae bacterium]|nr:hypothetical protein [Solirubrobacteraceae bacterium]